MSNWLISDFIPKKSRNQKFRKIFVDVGIENELEKYFSYFRAALNFREIQKTDFKTKDNRS